MNERRQIKQIRRIYLEEILQDHHKIRNSRAAGTAAIGRSWYHQFRELLKLVRKHRLNFLVEGPLKVIINNKGHQPRTIRKYIFKSLPAFLGKLQALLNRGIVLLTLPLALYRLRRSIEQIINLRCRQAQYVSSLIPGELETFRHVGREGSRFETVYKTNCQSSPYDEASSSLNFFWPNSTSRRISRIF